MEQIVSYLQKVSSELELIDSTWPIEPETYSEFERLRGQLAMCARRIYGADSANESRIWNVVTGEKYLRSTYDKREQRFVAAIAELSTEARIMSDEQLLFGSTSSLVAQSDASQSTPSNTTIFLIHGHNSLAKTEVARFIENLALKVSILHEQANSGRTILEKLEHFAGGAAYAVVLLTADDEVIGSPSNSSTYRQARQNVVFELGYFCGVAGRSRVAVLFEEGVALPSDLAGLVYIRLDPDGAWRLALARELASAGLPAKIERLIS